MKKISILFVIVLMLIYGTSRADTVSGMQCEVVATEDIFYWYEQTKIGSKAAAQNMLHFFANPQSEYYSQKDALFWFFYLGKDYKKTYAFTELSLLTKGIDENEIHKISQQAKGWVFEKSPPPVFNPSLISQLKALKEDPSKFTFCGFKPESISDQCGNLFGIDGGFAFDGPYLFINRYTGTLRGKCSFWTGECVVPVEWTCDCPKARGDRRMPCKKDYSDENRKKL